MILRIEIEITDGGDRTLRDKLFEAQDELEQCIDRTLEDRFDLQGQPAIWRHIGFNVSHGQVGA